MIEVINHHYILVTSSLIFKYYIRTHTYYNFEEDYPCIWKIKGNSSFLL